LYLPLSRSCQTSRTWFGAILFHNLRSLLGAFHKFRAAVRRGHKQPE
jgi:hypothetical protein